VEENWRVYLNICRLKNLETLPASISTVAFDSILQSHQLGKFKRMKRKKKVQDVTVKKLKYNAPDDKTVSIYFFHFYGRLR
jgi:hypothetical protein